jgi:hypothetical protein
MKKQQCAHHIPVMVRPARRQRQLPCQRKSAGRSDSWALATDNRVSLRPAAGQDRRETGPLGGFLILQMGNLPDESFQEVVTNALTVVVATSGRSKSLSRRSPPSASRNTTRSVPRRQEVAPEPDAISISACCMRATGDSPFIARDRPTALWLPGELSPLAGPRSSSASASERLWPRGRSWAFASASRRPRGSAFAQY